MVSAVFGTPSTVRGTVGSKLHKPPLRVLTPCFSHKSTVVPISPLALGGVSCLHSG